MSDLDFNPDAFADLMDDYIEIADANIKLEYKRELNALRGLTTEQLREFGGTTSQLNEIIQEIEKARTTNLNQAKVIQNIRDLGESTYTLAKKVSALIP